MLEVIVEDSMWPEALENWADDTETALANYFDFDKTLFEISILACDAEEIRALNKEFRQKDKATNVLSWPAIDLTPNTPGDSPRPPQFVSKSPWATSLGDVAICHEFCAQEATAQKISLESHAKHLILHGFLHLLGYDHVDDQDADRMEAIEIEILANLGIVNPYLPILDETA